MKHDASKTLMSCGGGNRKGNGSQLTHSRDSNGRLSGLPLLQRGLGFPSSLLNTLGVLFVCPSLLRCLDLEMGHRNVNIGSCLA